MSKLIYQENSMRYSIDACLPQISAADKGKIELSALSHGQYPGNPLPKDLIPEVSTMGYLNVIGKQDWGMEAHRNEGIEICLQESGENTLIVDGKKYPLKAHSLSITRPWQLHRVGDPHLGPGRLHWIVIDVGIRRPNQPWQWPSWCVLTPDDLEELAQRLCTNEKPVWQADDELRRIFKRLASYTRSKEPATIASRMTVTINQLLISVLEHLRSQHTLNKHPFHLAAHTVNLFLTELRRSHTTASKEWTLDSMAHHCGMGRTAFSKYCYELQNISPIDYLNNCRLKHAAKRLRTEPTSSITQIAFDIGYSSSQYFSRTFKQKYGSSPSAWRQHTPE